MAKAAVAKEEVAKEEVAEEGVVDQKRRDRKGGDIREIFVVLVRVRLRDLHACVFSA